MDRNEKPGQIRAPRSRHAEKLATYAAGVCSAAERAPSPSEAMPRDAKRHSSSERGLHTRRLRDERMSVSVEERPTGCRTRGTVRQE